MTDRRDFLRRAGAALAAGALAPRLLHALEPRERTERIKRIGLQLYTVRDQMAKDVDRTLARVAQIGYKEVEFAGYFARTPQQIRKALDANGLTAPSSHIDIATVRAADWPRTLEDARTMGMSYLIVASLDDDDRVSQQSYRAAADTLISASRTAAAAGITLGYHNHNYEFEPLDGKTGLEVMLDRTAGSGVVFEMDLYWITSAGQDPLAWFAEVARTIPARAREGCGARAQVRDARRGRRRHGLEEDLQAEQAGGHQALLRGARRAGRCVQVDRGELRLPQASGVLSARWPISPAAR